jgi:hypothetical protein
MLSAPEGLFLGLVLSNYDSGSIGARPSLKA